MPKAKGQIYTTESAEGISLPNSASDLTNDKPALITERLALGNKNITI